MPMQRDKYPAYWERLSAHIRFVRANNHCEWCGVANGALIVRSSVDPVRYMQYDSAADCWRVDGNPVRLSEIPSEFAAPAVKVVLTVAHWPDPDTMNCRFSNLHALCQKCHNAADAPMRAKHAALTRQKRKQEAIIASGQLPLWGDRCEILALQSSSETESAFSSGKVHSHLDTGDEKGGGGNHVYE